MFPAVPWSVHKGDTSRGPLNIELSGEQERFWSGEGEKGGGLLSLWPEGQWSSRGGARKSRVCQGLGVKGVSVRTTTGPHSEPEWAQERAVVTTVFC